MSNFTCAACKGVFEEERPEREAVAEYEAIWGGSPFRDNAAVVCEDCYRDMLESPMTNLKADIEAASAKRTVH